MKKKCDCQHDKNSESSTQNSKKTHIIELLQNNFISPYKIMFMLDPKQADHFKARNDGSGCCSSNHVTIRDKELTKTEKYLKELISFPSLASDLNVFLQNCNQRYRKIVENGKKDNLQVTNQVEKFLLDKVLIQSVNSHILFKLSSKVKVESLSNNREIGLWATPATWYQRYPNAHLNQLPGQFLSSLLGKGWAFSDKYISNEGQLLRQLSILEKDGKFEQSKWLGSKKSKLLNNIQKFIQIKTSNDNYLFEQIRELTIKLSSVPFELNAKANLFCTVSPNLHILYTKMPFQVENLKGQLRYTIIVNIGARIRVRVNQQQIDLDSSSILMLDNTKIRYSIKNEKQVFLFFNYIGCVQRK